MSYQKFKEERDDLLFNTKAKYLREGKAIQLNNLIEGIYDMNTFITVFEYNSGEFVFYHNVEKHLRYNSDEFTISNLNNLGNPSDYITYEKDIVHKRRYDTAVYKLMTSNYKLQLNGDYYELKFRLYKKGLKSEENIIWVKRRCYILSVENEIPAAQLDRWEIIDKAELRQVHPYYPVATIKSVHHLNSAHLFYEANRELLGLTSLSPNQKEVMTFLIEGKKPREIATVLKVSENAVKTHRDRAKEKIRTFFSEVDPNIEANSMIEISNQLRRFGLYPFH